MLRKKILTESLAAVDEQIENITGKDEHLDSDENSQEDFELDATDENANINSVN